MCEIFAFSSDRCERINEYLETFYSHCDEHPHGWGLSIMQGNQSLIDKEPLKASESERLKKLLSFPLIVEHAFAHIRLATMGYMDTFNCHPFTRIDNNGRTWTLIHNGTVFFYEPLNKYISKQAGETDTERILIYIVDKINEIESKRKKELSPEECFRILDAIISDLAKGNKLNLLIFDGEYLYAHTNLRHSLHYIEHEHNVVISTTALTNEKWKELPLNTLLVFKDSKLVFKGLKHENEYIESEEHLKMIEKMISQI